MQAMQVERSLHFVSQSDAFTMCRLLYSLVSLSHSESDTSEASDVRNVTQTKIKEEPGQNVNKKIRLTSIYWNDYEIRFLAE